ncbi:hypothetical protein ACLB2K_072489 [Fragaria x ananassa]
MTHANTTFTVFLIKGLAVDADFFGDAKKYLIQMLDKGMYPNAATYTAVLEGFGRQEDKKAEEEGKESLEVMMLRGSFLDFVLFSVMDSEC